MLEPEGRQLLLDALRPPAGFVLDRAIGTTYTLDLTALLTAPVGFALLDREASDGRSTADPVALLDAVRRNAERIDIFCQAGAIALPSNYQPILTYVEQSIHEVVAPSPGAIFHPKVWVIRYRETEGTQLRYRLLVLSRNLTFDRSWDTVLRLDGAPGSRGWDANEPIARFLRALPAMTREPVTDALARDIEAVADELKDVRFELPADFESYLLWPFGLDATRPWPFPRKVDRMLVVSPFLTQGCLQRLAGSRSGTDVLVSRPESLDALGSAALAAMRETLILSGDTDAPLMPGADGDADAAPDPATTEAAAVRPGVELRGLHAKLFVAEVGERTLVWTGSANATDAAFGGNVEFLVELRGRRERIGIDRVIGHTDGALSLRDLLESYLPASAEPEEPTAQETFERRLDAARRSLAGYSFEARVTTGLDGVHELRLVGGRAATQAPEVDWSGIRVTCRPLSSPSAYAVPIEPDRVGIDVDFGSRSFEALTSFFAFELEGRVDGIDIKVGFLVNARLVGAPADRRERTLVSLLRNRGDLLRFLLFLLGGEAGSSAMVELGPRLFDALVGTDAEPPAIEWQSLFEPMVRALAHDPRTLDDIARLVRDLERTDAGKALLPEDWSAIWQPISAVRAGQVTSG